VTPIKENIKRMNILEAKTKPERFPVDDEQPEPKKCNHLFIIKNPHWTSCQKCGLIKPVGEKLN
jgi:hypothetical protein